MLQLFLDAQMQQRQGKQINNSKKKYKSKAKCALYKSYYKFIVLTLHTFQHESVFESFVMFK